jgi:hypothetical protein
MRECGVSIYTIPASKALYPSRLQGVGRVIKRLKQDIDMKPLKHRFERLSSRR